MSTWIRCVDAHDTRFPSTLLGRTWRVPSSGIDAWLVSRPSLFLKVCLSVWLSQEVKIKFGQIYLSTPMITESDGENSRLFPKEARLRSVTYSAPLYVDVKKTELSRNEDGQPEAKVQTYPKVFIGKVRDITITTTTTTAIIIIIKKL